MPFEDIVSQAVRTLLKHGKQAPTLLIRLNGLDHPLQRPLRSFPAETQYKQAVVRQQGRQLAEVYPERSVQQVWFLSEAWESSFDASRSVQIAPSQNPRRREVLCVIELDATSDLLLQRIEVLQMRRNRNRKLIGVSPLPELSSQGGVTPQGILLLSFLSGFVEGAASSSVSQWALSAKILQTNLLLTSLLGEGFH